MYVANVVAPKHGLHRGRGVAVIADASAQRAQRARAAGDPGMAAGGQTARSRGGQKAARWTRTRAAAWTRRLRTCTARAQRSVRSDAESRWVWPRVAVAHSDELRFVYRSKQQRPAALPSMNQNSSIFLGSENSVLVFSREEAGGALDLCGSRRVLQLSTSVRTNSSPAHGSERRAGKPLQRSRRCDVSSSSVS